jgi:hypothetical protein
MFSGLTSRCTTPCAWAYARASARLAQEAHGDGCVERALTRETLSQALAFDVWHRVVRQPVKVTGAEQREHVRVLQASGEPDLAFEALGGEARRQVRVQDLDHDAAAEPRVRRHEHA